MILNAICLSDQLWLTSANESANLLSSFIDTAGQVSGLNKAASRDGVLTGIAR
jgi:hypothetical protein